MNEPATHSRLMLHMCRPGRSVMVVYQRDKTATVQLCSVGVCLSFSIERRWQKGKWRTPEVYLSRVNLMSVFLFAARGKMPFFFFFFDLMSLAGQKEIPLPLLPLLPLSFSFSYWCSRGQLCPVCTGNFSRCSPLVYLYVLTHCCVFAVRPSWSREPSQETVWPPSVNYVFTAKPGSHWACSAQYVSPARRW